MSAVEHAADLDVTSHNSIVLSAAQAVLGTRVLLPIIFPTKTFTNGVEPDALSTTNDRYLGVHITTTGAPTTGEVNIGLTLTPNSSGPRHSGAGH